MFNREMTDLTVSPDSSNAISVGQLAEMAWKDYQYKHHNFWAILYRAVLAYAVIISVPVLYDGALIERYLLVFPLIALSICLMSTWILFAEYRLVRQSFEIFIHIFRGQLQPLYEGHPHWRPRSFDRDPLRPLGFAVGHLAATAWLILGTAIGMFAMVALSGH